MASSQPFKDDYEAALFKAATDAANVVAAVFKPDKTAYEPFEKEQLEVALKLLAIVQGSPSPK